MDWMQDIGIVSTYSFVVSFPCLCDFVLCCGNLVHELLVIALAVEVRIGFNNHFEGCFNFVYSLIRNCAILPCTSVNYVYKSLVLMLVIRLHAVYEIWIQVCPPFFLHFDCRFGLSYLFCLVFDIQFSIFNLLCSRFPPS